MEAWIEFGRGPLFRLALSLMMLGLLRVLFLTAAGLVEAYRNNADRVVPWPEVARQTVAWLFPLGRLWKRRPVYGTLSVLFHAGLLAVPPLLAAHVLLWKRSAGFAWPPIPQPLADGLTILVVLAGLGLVAGRLSHAAARQLSRRQDYAWLLLLLVPFVTGYACSNTPAPPRLYQALMLVHVYSANLILLLLPFTKLAHCVLAPLSQMVTSVAWKFPAGGGDRVAATLGYADRPTWADKSRLEGTVSK